MRFRSKKLLSGAKGRSCVICEADDGTIVPAHLPHGGYHMAAGTSEKTHDWLVAHLCARCHERMDGEWRNDFQMRMIALCSTLERLFDEGVIVVR